MRQDRPERRAAARIATHTLAHYGMRRRDGLWNLSGLARSEDLSLSGVRLETPEALPVGETLDLTFRVDDTVLTTRAHIAWVQERRATRSYAAGLAFEGVNIDFLAGLTRCGLAATAPHEPFEATELRDRVRALTTKNASGLLIVETGPAGCSFIAFQAGHVVAVRSAAGDRGVGAICSILVQPKGVFAFLPADLSCLAAEHGFRLPADFDRESDADTAEPSALAA